MARRPRVAPPDSFSHVSTTGNREQAIFIDDADREFFLFTLQRYMPVCELKVHAYCLMTTHLHLVVEVAGVPLSRSMQRVLQVYAQRFNRRHGYRGHLFADRFWSQPCETDAYLLEAVRYVHLNPVWAGIVRRPEFYRWSSHRAYLNLEAQGWVVTDSVLQMFGRSPDDAVHEYALFVEEGLPARARSGGFE